MHDGHTRYVLHMCLCVFSMACISARFPTHPSNASLPPRFGSESLSLCNDLHTDVIGRATVWMWMQMGNMVRVNGQMNEVMK